jgi:hypothetical protein
LREALSAVRAWALSSFHAASSPEEAWQAKMRADAANEFAAVMLATIQLGKQAAGQLMTDREKMSRRKKERQSAADYMTEAAEARSAYLKKLKVAS